MITNRTANAILNAMTGKAQNASIASRAFIGLSSTEPNAQGQGITEPVGGGYERKQIGYYNDTYGQYMGTPVDGVITNNQEIHFNEATGDWGEQKYVCIFDAATGGNLVAWGELGEYEGGDAFSGTWKAKSITPKANTVVVLKVGNVRISIS